MCLPIHNSGPVPSASNNRKLHQTEGARTGSGVVSSPSPLQREQVFHFTSKLARLPLPADVGKAIAAYLKDGRPHSPSRFLFLKARAPVVGLKNSGSVCLIVGKALVRSGIDGRRKGAHQFRHTLATEMLRQGSSLAEIGEVLRHRNPQTTSIYAKVILPPCEY